MKTVPKARLTSAELANLWNLYIIESLLIPMKIPFINNCQQQDIKEVFQFALKMSQAYVAGIAKIYKEENHPIPIAFSEEDMNPDAPALFTDKYALCYLHGMAKLGLRIIPEAMSVTTRQDILDLLFIPYGDYKELYQRTLNLMLSKGIYPKSAAIPIPERVEYIEKDSYFAGWVGKQRPMNASEIMNYHYSIMNNSLSKTLLIGFSQVTEDKEIRDYMLKGVKICSAIISDLENTLMQENISVIPTLDSEVLPSTVAPYSEKLMLSHVVEMGAGSIALYGTRLSTVYRRDIGLQYIKMIKDALQYSAEGVDLMVKRVWLEQPPTSVDSTRNS